MNSQWSLLALHLSTIFYYFLDLSTKLDETGKISNDLIVDDVKKKKKYKYV